MTAPLAFPGANPRGLLALAVCVAVAVGIGLVFVLVDEVWRDNRKR